MSELPAATEPGPRVQGHLKQVKEMYRRTESKAMPRVANLSVKFRSAEIDLLI